MNHYRFKRSFSDDPTLSPRLFLLLEAAFPGLGISNIAQHARTLGAPWEGVSTPFVRFEADMAVTHVGVLEIPMVVMGQTVTVGGVHGVCTHPDFRRRGYFRQVMEEVLEYCASCYETLLLTTAQPEFYSSFGFRVVEEYAFVTKCTSTSHTNGFRVLNTQDPDDLKLLHRLLSDREPVSNVVGVVNEKAVFCFNEGTRPLHYATDLNALAYMEIEGTRLKLFDLVGTQICPLTAVVERIPQHLDEVVIYFSPDRLEANVQAFPHVLDGDSLLMVRGSFAAEGQPFMLPRSARC
ncbi:MAG TPA: GNAT family N-acetyltransferase [Coleofasciculaceae cyanobacterium]